LCEQVLRETEHTPQLLLMYYYQVVVRFNVLHGVCFRQYRSFQELL
jgi:hypothetical protein